MKRILNLVLLCSVYFSLNAQEWIQQLPQEKLKNSELTFFEIQEAFNAYCIDNNIKEGKKTVAGVEQKVAGYKQFKRWEWYWESRVNPVTGVFPDKGALDQLKIHQASKSTSNKNSGAWQAMGPTSSYSGYSGLGRLNCIAFHPNDNDTYWVGSPSGGVWKTTNDGLTWTVLTDSNEVLGVSEIIIPSDYETSNTLYIATGDRDGGSMWSLGGGASSDNNSIGVLKSTNGGLSWEPTGFSYDVSENKRIGRLVKHPDNDSIFIMGTSDGIYRTTDTMKTWSQVYSGTYVIDIEFKTNNADTVYATNRDYYDDTEVLMSTDNGATWNSLYTFPEESFRAQIAVTPADSNCLYVIVCIGNGGLEGIYKSIDGGDTFTQVVYGSDSYKSYLYYYSDGSGDNDGQGSYDLCIAASPSDENIAIIGGVNAWKTIDGGDEWRICNMWTSYDGYNMDNAPVVHADKHLQVYRNDGTLFETNDGGVYKSTDNGLTWEDKTNGLAISQPYRLGVSQTNEEVVIIGLQDNGSKMINGNDWNDVTGGDGMECIIDPTDVNVQYATYVRGRIYRTDDMWYDYKTISSNIGDGELTGAWVTPYILDKNDESTLYVGYSDVWKSEDKGESFTKISTIDSPNKIRSMAIAPSNSEYLYVADYTHMYAGENTKAAWVDITSGLPVADGNITYIAVKEDDPLTVWVTLGGYNNKGVYETTDGGDTWANISEGLPELPVMTIVQNKRANGLQLFVGTDVGVYVKNGDDAWEQFSQGLPNVVVTELELYYDADDYYNVKLRAAAYGRGLWESTVEIVGGALVANFSANAEVVEMEGSVQFTDESAPTPTTWEWTFEGGTPATSTDQNPQVVYETPGVYDVILAVSNDDENNTLTKEDLITVEWKMPEIDFTATPQQGLAPLSVQFTAVTEYATAWTWDFGDGESSTDQNPEHVYSQGSFAVKLTASNSDYTDAVEKVDFISVNLTTIPEGWQNKLKVYPNPASDQLNISFEGVQGISKIMLIDLLGKVIDEQTVKSADAGLTIDVSQLKADNYLLQIVSETNIVVLKVVVE